MKALKILLLLLLALLACATASFSESCSARHEKGCSCPPSCPCCKGECGGRCDMVRMGCTCGLQSGQKVNNVLLILNEGTVSGEVAGHCIAVGSRLTIAGNAEVKGDLVTLFSILEKRAEPLVSGRIVSLGTIDISHFPPFLRFMVTLWEPLLALVLLLSTFGSLKNLSLWGAKKPALVLLLGFAGLLLFVPASLLGGTASLIMLTILAVFSSAGFALGFSSMACLVGERISPALIRSPLLRALIAFSGLVALSVLLAFVPSVGAYASEILKMSLRTLGLGLLLSIPFSSMKKPALTC
ncbi:MAG: hypothetical protein RDV48_15665 [Candidatus Eremiobacteraeota bacterium]|nr:hypothetical protein [Candidatus Eremiobacteraeota bacterium]